jgi:uncharacterized protein YndB with AHSA1/START domain
VARDDGASALPGRVTRAVPATAERIWAALTDPATVRRWWGELSPDLQVGQLSQLVLDNGDRYAVEVFRMRPPRLLEYGLRYFAIDVKEAVRWRIAPQDAGCLVTVEFVAPQRDDERRGAEHEEWRERTERLETFLAGRPVPPGTPDRELILSTDLPGDVASVRAHLAQFLDGRFAGTLTVRDGAEPDGFHVMADGDVSASGPGSGRASPASGTGCSCASRWSTRGRGRFPR